jgi:SAM-dependent methyltransferase
MTLNTTPSSKLPTPNYGIDAPAVLRNLFLFGSLAVLLAAQPYPIHLGPISFTHQGFYWMGGIVLAEAFLYLLYVKVGKLRHRDRILALHRWRGDEQVLDVGCGRGLLLAGAAKLVPDGHATGIDLWSQVDMGANSPDATRRNLEIEGIAARCSILSIPAQEMTFTDDSFDVIVSNLCLHNISDREARTVALNQIARVLKPGGVVLLSDYKHTREYTRILRSLGLNVDRRPGESPCNVSTAAHCGRAQIITAGRKIESKMHSIGG